MSVTPKDAVLNAFATMWFNGLTTRALQDITISSNYLFFKLSLTERELKVHDS